MIDHDYFGKKNLFYSTYFMLQFYYLFVFLFSNSWELHIDLTITYSPELIDFCTSQQFFGSTITIFSLCDYFNQQNRR